MRCPEIASALSSCAQKGRTLLPSAFRIFKYAKPGLKYLSSCLLCHSITAVSPTGCLSIHHQVPKNKLEWCVVLIIFYLCGQEVILPGELHFGPFFSLMPPCTHPALSTGVATGVAGSWDVTMAKRKLLHGDYPVFFCSHGNYLQNFPLNSRTELSLKIHTLKNPLSWGKFGSFRCVSGIY